jgi:hypothetical protein
MIRDTSRQRRDPLLRAASMIIRLIPPDNAVSSPNHNYLNTLTSVLWAVSHGRHNHPGYGTVHIAGVPSCPERKSKFSIHRVMARSLVIHTLQQILLGRSIIEMGGS